MYSKIYLHMVKYQVLHNDLMHRYRLKVEWLKTCSVDRDFGVLVDSY